MLIFLNQLNGEQTCVQLKSESWLDELRALAPEGSRLICEGSALHKNNFDLLLKHHSNVYVTGDLDGGKKKKKKKVYANKKKNKHIHKRVKMAIHNLYVADAAGNVTQQRKTCPKCSHGIFMGQHWDRYYCGLCHTSIKMDPETVLKNEEALRIKREQIENERKLKEKELADKAPAGKKKDAKKAAKKK